MELDNQPAVGRNHRGRRLPRCRYELNGITLAISTNLQSTDRALGSPGEIDNPFPVRSARGVRIPWAMGDLSHVAAVNIYLPKGDLIAFRNTPQGQRTAGSAGSQRSGQIE